MNAISLVVFALARAIALGQGEALDRFPCPDSPVTYKIVEVMPEFPGGEAELHKYLGRAIRYPADAQALCGTVLMSFTIREDGSLCGANVRCGAGNTLSAAWMNNILTMLRSMPRWKPGEQRGEPVSVEYQLPLCILLK